MILFVANGARRYPQYERFLGDFITPKRWSHQSNTATWAADNGCFGDFDPDQFRRMLDACAAQATRPKFVTVPDVVGNHRATMDRWLEWSREFEIRKLPRAMVLQNGIEQMPPEFAVPWSLVDALFIGGDDTFKLGPWVHWCIQFSKRAIKPNGTRIWTHMGRVNSVRRLSRALFIGCDSADGSGMARFPEAVLLPMLKRLASRQLQLL